MVPPTPPPTTPQPSFYFQRPVEDDEYVLWKHACHTLKPEELQPSSPKIRSAARQPARNLVKALPSSPTPREGASHSWTQGKAMCVQERKPSKSWAFPEWRWRLPYTEVSYAKCLPETRVPSTPSREPCISQEVYGLAVALGRGARSSQPAHREMLAVTLQMPA